MVNKNVGWGDAGTPTAVDQTVNVGVRSSPQPTCWLPIQLGDIVHVQSGVGFPKRFQGKSDGQYPVYKVGDVSKAVLGANGILRLAGHTVTESEVAELKGKVFCVGTTLFAKIGEAVRLNRRAFVAKEGLADNNVMGVTPVLSESNKFVYYFMRTINLSEASRSTTVPSIRKGDIEELKLFLPPLAEQKQIAATLDQLLARVEAIKTRLDAIPALLKRFRQSVLAAAVSGRLTEEWRKKSKSSLNEWKLQKIGDIVRRIEAGKSLKCIERPPFDDEFGIIKISAVTWGEYDENESKTLSDNELFRENRRVEIGDFLISRANTIELLGNPVIVQKVTKNLMLSDKVLRLVMPEKDKAWVSIFLRSFYGRKEIESRSTGNQLSMRNIGQKALLDIDIPMAPVLEQTQIVHRVEQLFAFADQIEARVKAAQSRVDHLTQSILARAFRGELTAEWRAQHPELISGEHSAAALLARIQAARVSAPVKKCARKKSS